MNIEIDKYILKRLKDNIPVQYNSFRDSKENRVKKLSREGFNEVLKVLKEKDLINYSIDTSIAYEGQPTNIEITSKGLEYYKIL